MKFFENINKDFSSWIQDSGFGIIKAVLVLLIGWRVIDRVNKLVIIFFQKANIEAGLVSFLNSVLKFTLRVVLCGIALACVGLDFADIFTAIGTFLIAVGAIGIALKDNFLANLISGVMLVANRPIHIGDYIEFEKIQGTVIKVEMLFTTLQTQEEDKIVIIPNSRLIANNITRKSRYNMSQIKVNYKFQSIEDIKNLSENIKLELMRCEHVLHVPSPEVEISKIDDGTMLAYISVWCEKQFENRVKNGLNILSSKIIARYNLEILEP